MSKGAKLKNNEQEESTLPLATLQSFRHLVCVIGMSLWSCIGLSTSLTHPWPCLRPTKQIDQWQRPVPFNMVIGSNIMVMMM